MSEYYILDAAGEPHPCEDLMEWARWMEANRHNRHLAADRDEGPDRVDIWISTVFLGLNHNFMGKGPPVLWETMVFGGLLDREMERYTSKAAALRGHQAMCERVAASLRPPRSAAPSASTPTA